MWLKFKAFSSREKGNPWKSGAQVFSEFWVKESEIVGFSISQEDASKTLLFIPTLVPDYILIDEPIEKVKEKLSLERS